MQKIIVFSEPYNPFRNKTLTSFKRLNTLTSMQDLFYYDEMLGYKYDKINIAISARCRFQTGAVSQNGSNWTFREYIETMSAHFSKNLEAPGGWSVTVCYCILIRLSCIAT